jgi:hypothetical protein
MPFLILVPLAILCFIGAAFTSMPIVLVAIGSAYLGAGITWLIMAVAALPEVPMEVQPSKLWSRPAEVAPGYSVDLNDPAAAVAYRLRDLPGEVMKTKVSDEIPIKKIPPRRDGEVDAFAKWTPVTEEDKKKRHDWLMSL